MADWIGITGTHYESECGSTDGRTLYKAISGTSCWQHDIGHDGDTHFFVIDLGENEGKFYTLTKFRGRSNSAADSDPIDVDIYVSETDSDYGVPVVSGISNWLNTVAWVEALATTKTGRYIKVIVNDTEAANQIIWGNFALPFQIFDAYGYIAVLIAGTSGSVSSASGSLTIIKDLQGSAASNSGVVGYMDINPPTGDSISLAGIASGLSSLASELDVEKSLIGSISNASNAAGILSSVQELIGVVNSISSITGELDVLTDTLGTIAASSNLQGVLSVLTTLSSLTNSVSSISSQLSVETPMAGSIGSISGTVSELTVKYMVYSNASAKKWYDMIQRQGVDATIRVYPVKEFNSTTQKTMLHNVREFTVKVIPPYRNREGFQEAEMITSGIGMSGIANYKLEFVVAKGIEIVIADKTWTVIGIQEIKDNSGILVYLFEIESGS